jgi:hypothetical protein
MPILSPASFGLRGFFVRRSGHPAHHLRNTTDLGHHPKKSGHIDGILFTYPLPSTILLFSHYHFFHFTGDKEMNTTTTQKPIELDASILAEAHNTVATFARDPNLSFGFTPVDDEHSRFSDCGASGTIFDGDEDDAEIILRRIRDDETPCDTLEDFWESVNHHICRYGCRVVSCG